MNNAVPTRCELARLAALAGWPLLRVGPLTVSGPEAWGSACDRAAPGERCRLAARLGRRLVLSVPVARQRFREFKKARRAGEVRAEGFAARLERVFRTVRLFGDSALLLPVSVALASLPRCVEWYIVKSCFFVTVGATVKGWTSGALPPDRFAVILAGGADVKDAALRSTTTHECVHRWFGTNRPEDETCTSHEESQLYRTGPDGDQRKAEREADETFTNLVVMAWECAARMRP